MSCTDPIADMLTVIRNGILAAKGQVDVPYSRIKDFRGLSPKGFDKAGNFNLGLREQALFHEVQLDKLEHNQGLQITICFKNSDEKLSLEVLKALHMPFREK